MVLALDESIAQIGFLVQIAAPEMDMPGTEPGLANQHAVIERLQSKSWSFPETGLDTLSPNLDCSIVSNAV
jgi:hypothetical protein